MTDRPILFSTPMIRALLDGSKTQTRRALKIKGYKGFFQFGPSDTNGYDWTFRRADHVWEDYKHGRLLSLLPHQIGDRLWVREAHYLTDDGEAEFAVYAADVEGVAAHMKDMQCVMASHPQVDWSKHLRLRPSIHMPRWASRITMTVTEVRVQRLQEISVGDAIAEGCLGYVSHDGEDGEAPQEQFRDLWNSINGHNAWNANPWIAAYNFTVHKRNIDQLNYPTQKHSQEPTHGN